MKTSDYVASIIESDSYLKGISAIEDYAKQVAADALAKACVGQPIEVQQKIMSVEIETP
jgi:hypothetical protein